MARKPWEKKRGGGRKGIFFDTGNANKKAKPGQHIINVTLSVPPVRQMKGGKMQKRRMIVKNMRWVEMGGGANLNARQLTEIANRRLKVAKDKRSLREATEIFMQSRLRIPTRDERKNNVRTLGSASDIGYKRISNEYRYLLKFRSKADISYSSTIQTWNFLRKEGRYEVGLRKGGKGQWLEKFGEQRKILRGIKQFDIQAAVKAYGKGIIPESVAKTGIWWRDTKIKNRPGHYYRDLHPELKANLEIAQIRRKNKMRIYRRKKDPLVGTRVIKKYFVPKNASKQADFLFALAEEKLTQKAAFKIYSIMQKIQDTSMQRMRRLVAWKNLTGNAITGLMSMITYPKASKHQSKYHLEQIPGLRSKRGTRGMISKGKFSRSSPMYGGQYIGKFYDNPSIYFHISEEKGANFITTTGHYAYNDAKKKLDQLYQTIEGMSVKRKNDASIMFVSGAPYIGMLKTVGGSDILTEVAAFAREEIIKQLNAMK